MRKIFLSALLLFPALALAQVQITGSAVQVGGSTASAGVSSAQGTSPIQVNGLSGTPASGDITIACPSCGQGNFQYNYTQQGTGQYVLVPFTSSVCSATTGGSSGNTNGSYGPPLVLSSGGFFITGGQTGSCTFSNPVLPSGVTTGQITAIYAVGWKAETRFDNANPTEVGPLSFSGTSIGGGAVLRNGSAGGMGPTPLQYGLQLTGTFANFSTLTATAAGSTNAFSGGGDLSYTSALEVDYTGTPVTQSGTVNLGPGFGWDPSTDTLSLLPFAIYPISVNSMKGLPAQTANTYNLVIDGATSADCATGGGSNTVWCKADGSGGFTGFPFGGSGGSGINQLTGDATAGPGSGSQALTLATVNSGPGACGDATHVCEVTTNGKGLVTAQSAVAITPGGAAITALTGDVNATGPGSAAATVVKVNNGAIPTSQPCVGTNSSAQFVNGSCGGSGGGISDPTVINLTASPYYASPYGATTTTGTFSASATSGTVGSCSNFIANNGVLIVGGASNGWTGTDYIGTVVSCTGTTMTITPAITNAVSGHVVQHDETAAFTAAITALTAGGVIVLPNASLTTQGIYLVNGPLQNTGTANAILQMPTINSGLANPNIKIEGFTTWFSSPIIQTSLSTSSAALFGAYGPVSPHLTGVGLWFKNVQVFGPASGSATMIDGTNMQALSFEGSVRVQAATSGIATTGKGVLFPSIANNVALTVSGILGVSGFGTAVRLGEHSAGLDILVSNSQNGIVFDVAPNGTFGDNTPNSISVQHVWCGPPSSSGGPTTVSNCLAAGSTATTIHVADVDYEGTGGTLINDPSSLLHGDVNYTLSNTASCPTSPTLSGATNLALMSLNCVAGGTKTVSVGSVSANHVAVFNSTDGSIKDGGSVPSGGGGTGGGTSGWSGTPLTFASNATQYAPWVGGAATSTTESIVQNATPASSTITGLQVNLSASLGTGTTLAVTLRDGGISTGLTCTTSSGGTSCSDATHTATISEGDHLDFLLTSTGTVTAGTPQIAISYAVGTPVGGYSVLSAPPALAGFTNVNFQSGTTATQSAPGNITLTVPNNATDQIQYIEKSIGIATPWRISAYFSHNGRENGSSDGFSNGGLYLSDGTKVVTLESFFYGGATYCNTKPPGCMRVDHWTNNTTETGNVWGGDNLDGAKFGAISSTGGYWAVCDDGTNIYYEQSWDGVAWTSLFSEAVGSFITPTEVGIGAGAGTGGSALAIVSLRGFQIASVGSCP